jgi:flavin-binding protein dodecin
LIMESNVEEHAVRGLRADAAKVDYKWLSRWKFQFRVSLRQPNRKWSVPRRIMKERLETVWCNIFRVRRLMARSLGYEPVIENFDQSPFHMNEVGSKSAGSLTITGGGSVALVEGHAATRERWSANTMVASRSAVAGRLPPLQLMFKAKSGARVLPKLQDSCPCWAPWLSVGVSPSGSYCESDILNYLELVLDPMSPDRDWRILLVDAYAAQTTQAVRRACWHRGYVLISHGGGTTGVSQVNDTDLHQALKRQYMELESAEMLDQQRLRPAAVPVPRKEDCIQWMASVWHNPALHTAAADGFLKTGQANALDGSQDHRICRESRLFWDESQMWRRRAEVTHDVDVEFDSGRLAWSYNDVDRLVLAFPKHGPRYDAVHSDEGSDEPDEDASDGRHSDDDDDGDDDEPAVAGCEPAVAGCGEPAVAGCEPAVPDHAGAAAAAGPLAGPLALVSMDAAEADLVHDYQHSLDVLRVVLEQVRAVGQDALAATVSHAIVVQERKCRGTKRASDAVAQAMVGNHASAVADLTAAQTIVAKADAEAKRTRRTIRQLQEEHDRLQAARLALQRASTVVECLDAVKKFETGDLGQGHVSGGTKEHFKNRMQVLERLRRRFPPLPAEQQNDWEWFLPRWDKARLAHMHHLNRNAWGSQFKNEVLAILQSLREGDTLALSRWMAVQSRNFLCIPALLV